MISATGMSKDRTGMSEPPHSPAPADVVIDCNIKELHYGTFKAVRDTAIPIKKNAITAFIGPSGCGKSTLLRVLNRMYDLYPSQKAWGEVLGRRCTPVPPWQSWFAYAPA